MRELANIFGYLLTFGCLLIVIAFVVGLPMFAIAYAIKLAFGL